MTDGSKVSTATNLAALVLGVLSLVAIAPAYLNHDAAWYLYFVQRWFDGASVYRDVVDTNPPLIIWLTALPAAVARGMGWQATAAFKGFVFLIAAASVLVVRSLVRRVWPEREFLLVTAVAFLILPFAKGDFGQREHLAVLLTMPYVMLSASRDERIPSAMRVLTGAAAGVGFAIKPHFLLAWIGIEWIMFARVKWRSMRRPEFVAAVSVFVAYAVAVLALVPQYLEVAGQVRRVYGGLNSPIAVLMRLREVQLWIAALAVFLVVRWRREDRLPLAIFAVATGYLAAALIQFKGWGYQLYPARVYLVLFLAVAGAFLLSEVPALATLLRGGRRGLAVVFAAALIVAAGRYIAEAKRPATPDLVTLLMSAIAEQGGSLTVLSMRTIIYPAFPAVNYSGVTWGIRHNSLWFLPGFYSDQDRLAGGPLQPHTLESMPALERMFFDQIVEDLCRTPPQLLAIEQPAPVAPAGRRSLDLRAYYSQSPSAVKLLTAYRSRGTIGPFELLTPGTTPACR